MEEHDGPTVGQLLNITSQMHVRISERTGDLGDIALDIDGASKLVQLLNDTQADPDMGAQLHLIAGSLAKLASSLQRLEGEFQDTCREVTSRLQHAYADA